VKFGDVINPTPERLRLARRLIARCTPMANGCLEMSGHRVRGYTRISIGPKGNNRIYQGHVAAYILFVGPVPDGHEVHHKCENKACVNVNHLEALTHKEHVRRHDGIPGVNAAKTHCKNGHEFSPENTCEVPGGRACLTCRRENSRKWMRDNKEKARIATRKYRAKLKQERQESSQ
jgi:hypothetical protein